jgi:hypothetical protein
MVSGFWFMVLSSWFMVFGWLVGGGGFFEPMNLPAVLVWWLENLPSGG